MHFTPFLTHRFHFPVRNKMSFCRHSYTHTCITTILDYKFSWSRSLLMNQVMVGFISNKQIKYIINLVSLNITRTHIICDIHQRVAQTLAIHILFHKHYNKSVRLNSQSLPHSKHIAHLPCCTLLELTHHIL